MRRTEAASVVPGVTSRFLLLNMTTPQFSMAIPGPKSSTGTRSTLGSAYGVAKYSSKKSRTRVAQSLAGSASAARPSGAHVRTTAPFLDLRSTRSHSPAVNPSRYVLMRGVFWKRHSRMGGYTLGMMLSSVSGGMLDRTWKRASKITRSENVALLLGSSKHGKHRRALVGSKCVLMVE